MPRGLRINEPDLVYHVLNRGVKQLPIFHDDEDRSEFLDWLRDTKRKYPVEVHQFALMTNHYHFLLRPLEACLSSLMQCFTSRFAVWFNRKYRHSGHAFEGRFHSIPVQEDRYYTTVSRYIHLNPVRAGIVSRPEDYRWSNYADLLAGENNPHATGGLVLDYFGTDPIYQRLRYREFVESVLDKPEPLTHRMLLKMRSWGQLPIKIGSQSPAIEALLTINKSL